MTSTDPYVWLLWGSREGEHPQLLGCYADREVALAAQDAAAALPRTDDVADIWVAPRDIRSAPKLRAAVAPWLARKVASR